MDLTQQFNNMIVVPQFPLWFIPQDDNPDEEEGDENDPNGIDELDVIGQRDGDEQDSERWWSQKYHYRKCLAE